MFQWAGRSLTPARSGPGAEAGDHRGAAVAAQQAALQDGLHVLVLGGVLGVAQTLSLRGLRARAAKLPSLRTHENKGTGEREREKHHQVHSSKSTPQFVPSTDIHLRQI